VILLKPALLALTGTLVIAGCAKRYPLAPARPWADVFGDSLFFFTTATDPNGLKLSYTFDWGDGNRTTTSAIPSGDTAYSTHSFAVTGTHNVRVIATNEKGLYSSWSAPLSFRSSQPPTAEDSIAGPERWAVDRWYRAPVRVFDPDGDSVSVKFVWGDLPGATWTSFVPSGTTVTDSCMWAATGLQTVRVVVKDRGSMVACPDLSKTVGVSPRAVLWTNSEVESECSPVLGTADGHIVVCGVYYHDVWCVNADGTTRWKLPLDPMSARFAPSVSADGSRLYVADDNRGLLCFDVGTGAVIWRLDQQLGDCTPILGPNGIMYLTGVNGVTRVRDLDDSARVEWTYNAGRGTCTNVVVDAAGTVYGVNYGGEGRRDARAFALDTAGALLWQDTSHMNRAGGYRSCPALDSRERLIVASAMDSLACINTDGSLAWVAEAPQLYGGGISVGYDDRIYLQSASDCALYCLDSDGRFVWDVQTENFPGYEGNLCVLADSSVLSINSEDYITCVGWNGLVAWEFSIWDSLETAGRVASGRDEGDEAPTPAVAPDGNAYLCYEYGLCCLAMGNSRLAPTAWPTYNHDNARSGWAGRH
jgi:hypothetical protein